MFPRERAPTSRETPAAPSWLSRNLALSIVCAALVVIAILRVRVADVPLERDEGEYAYAGQLILHGIPPYQQVYNMKFPGTYYAYGLILALFGETRGAIHGGLLCVNAATTLLLFALGRRLGPDLLATIAALTFALLSLDFGILGVFAHATHFALLPALGALLLLHGAPASPARWRLFASGVLLGVAVLMKQHAVFFLPLAAALLVFESRVETRPPTKTLVAELGVLSAGAILPFTLVCVVFFFQGVLSKFWFWTFRYARAYVTEIPLSGAASILLGTLGDITARTLPLWLCGAAGLVALWTTRWDARVRVFATGLLAASFLSVCPGFYFRPHYFILLLPAIGLLAGVAAVSLVRVLGSVFSPKVATASVVSIFAALVAVCLWQESPNLFTMTPRELSRARYGTNPFVEAVEIARYVRERTGPEDRIAVLGSEPEIYFYAGRTSATGYIYMYPLMEPQPYASSMQQEMIREIEAAHPSYLIYAQVAASWLARPESDFGILSWAGDYAEKCFDLVGIADIYDDTTRYLWDDQVRGYHAASRSIVFTFRRKSDLPCAVATTSPPGRG